jgi:hypothetical protein
MAPEKLPSNNIPIARKWRTFCKIALIVLVKLLSGLEFIDYYMAYINKITGISLNAQFIEVAINALVALEFIFSRINKTIALNENKAIRPKQKKRRNKHATADNE